jgi:multimeric flavodoxin WrbA
MADTEWRFEGLKAMFVNCTLKKSPEPSHTEGLVRLSREIMEKRGIQTELVRAVDHDIAIGVWPDMTEHGWERDEWPQLYPRVLDADILVLCGPIWLGDNSSVMKMVIERLYACSHLLNDAGQYAYYGRVGGCLITGNEDGVKHCAMNIQPATPRLHDPAPGRRRLDRRGRAGTVVPRPRIRWPGERLHQPQHGVHDVEPDASGQDAEGRRRRSCSREPALRVGRRLPLRLPEPRLPLTSRGYER